ncbi:MCE family protein [Actinomadura alba]|uniref:MCE family protein n=1 Tax=Actinomadura alba TaxID=406431 RepID=A0ABR7LUR2_9ACTN|nr:MCE family protein [Actinomadura alba]MBC6468586.1 MCE family protein [Actinomadura alba]
MNPDLGRHKLLRRLSGVAFLLVLALLMWLSVAAYDKRFTPVAMVTLRTGSVGNEMHPHAEVKMRGVVVGEVRRISADGGGARLRLAIQPGMVRRIPANVSAQMLPTTLFGQRFVALIPPARPVPGRLSDGSVIEQDRSQNAIELEQVLRNVLPLLTAVQPQKLSATLTAVAQALQGRGTRLGQTLVEIDSYLRRMNPQLPALNRDIKELVRVTHAYAEAAPDILQAMNDFTVTSRTVVEQRAELSALYGTVGGTAQDLDTFLRENRGNLIRLSADSRPTLRLLAKYAPSFPCTLQTLTDFVPAMDKALGKGTREPGLHVTVEVVPSRGRYIPGRDRPVYQADSGPSCPSVPYGGTGGGSASGAAMPGAVPVAGSGGGAAPTTDRGRGLGLPNSPEENRLVNELVAPALATPPLSLPDWSSVLVGPIYRGAGVRLR